MDIKSSLDKLVSLQQHFIDTFNPNLNVDLVASSSGYHLPITQDMRAAGRRAKNCVKKKVLLCIFIRLKP